MSIASIRSFISFYRLKQHLKKSKPGFDKRYVEAYEILKDEFAERKVSKGEKFYYYIGPLDEKTREFCAYMLKLDKVFADYEIEYMSQILGYDMLKYEGSYNCRHRWVRFRGKVIYTPAPTDRQIQNLIEKNINYK